MWQARLSRSLLVGFSFHFPCGLLLGGVVVVVVLVLVVGELVSP